MLKLLLSVFIHDPIGLTLFEQINELVEDMHFVKVHRFQLLVYRILLLLLFLLRSRHVLLVFGWPVIVEFGVVRLALFAFAEQTEDSLKLEVLHGLDLQVHNLLFYRFLFLLLRGMSGSASATGYFLMFRLLGLLLLLLFWLLAFGFSCQSLLWGLFLHLCEC